MNLNRRSLILSSFASAAALASPRIAWAAANTDRRFVFIVQRGAADGLAILAPTGDPAFVGARGDIASTAGEGAKLDSLFTLHASLGTAAQMFAQKQAMFAHAVTSAYNERSHFDGQNVLETGGSRPYARSDGWMNRLLTLLPAHERKALALANAIPPALRGPINVGSYAPSRLPDADAMLMERVAMMYAEDKMLAPLWAAATETEAMAGTMDTSAAGNGAAAFGRRGGDVGKLAANLMAGPDGARVVMIESSGWDTHSAQHGRISNALSDIDKTIATLRTELGDAWGKTLVLVATEFGRTVHANGTKGTDHGTAFATMIFGGGLVKGGTIIADWPGLATGQLHEGRDLKGTMRFEQLVADTLGAHYAIDPGTMRRTLFPDFV